MWLGTLGESALLASCGPLYPPIHHVQGTLLTPLAPWNSKASCFLQCSQQPYAEKKMHKKLVLAWLGGWGVVVLHSSSRCTCSRSGVLPHVAYTFTCSKAGKKGMALLLSMVLAPLASKLQNLTHAY